jgi:hypothetical protein
VQASCVALELHSNGLFALPDAISRKLPRDLVHVHLAARVSCKLPHRDSFSLGLTSHTEGEARATVVVDEALACVARLHASGTATLHRVDTGLCAAAITLPADGVGASVRVPVYERRVCVCVSVCLCVYGYVYVYGRSCVSVCMCVCVSSALEWLSSFCHARASHDPPSDAPYSEIALSPDGSQLCAIGTSKVHVVEIAKVGVRRLSFLCWPHHSGHFFVFILARMPL